MFLLPNRNMGFFNLHFSLFFETMASSSFIQINRRGDNIASVGKVISSGNGFICSDLTINIIVNGKTIETKTITSDKNIMIEVKGDVIESIAVEGSGNIHVSGNVGGNVETVSGDASVAGDVQGSVKTTSGDAKITGNVAGDVKTVSGEVRSQSISGKVSTVSGDVRHS
jgi:hypothetical protein